MARKILLADDSVTAQNMGRKILADAGYEVIAVNNGSAALKKIAEIKPDLVILDVYMPGYSGLEVCQRLKESQETARIPVLLTVGKLEPFKPEEAKRVRAEGFIVKPFEASELLSTLSKLEDKVVPRSEPSKPGRFARAIALAEEASQGRRSETGDTGEGWQSRLGMPHAKAKAEEKVEEESTIYNAMNRDLRTVPEKPVATSDAPKAVESDARREAVETNVDVGALAPAGLPKDVTAEELAAIAAAAAQIQMAAAVASEAENSEKGFAEAEAAAPAAEQADDNKAGDRFPSTSEVGATGADSGSDTFGREPERERRNGDSPSAESEDVPVTMAAASQSQVDANAGEAKPGASRWTAVSVALEGEEASMSLDQEMQKAHAAFSASVNVSASQAESLGARPAEAAAAPEIAGADAPAEMAAPETVIASAEGVSQTQAVPEPDPGFETRAAEIETGAVTTSDPVAESASPAAGEPLNPYQILSAKEPDSAVDSSAAQPEPAERHFESFAPTGAVAESQEPVASTASADAVADAASNSEAQSAPEAGVAIPESATAGLAPVASEPEASLDPDTVKTTAAAWASWRQIRDTGKNGGAGADSDESPERDPASEDTNAKAVAAGAEQIDQANEAPQNPSDVASIVDSVLADLRPKLMAEISRKMSEKK